MTASHRSLSSRTAICLAWIAAIWSRKMSKTPDPQSLRVPPESLRVDFFDIVPPDGPVPIRMKYSVIDDLRKAVNSTQRDVEGFLLGFASARTLCIEGCEFLPPTETLSACLSDQPSTTRNLFERRAQTLSELAPKVIGFFHTQPTGFLEMSESDRRATQQCLSASGGLCLLLRTSTHRPWLGALYRWDANEPHKPSRGVDFFVLEEDILRNGYVDLPDRREAELRQRRRARPWFRPAVGMLAFIVAFLAAVTSWPNLPGRTGPMNTAPSTEVRRLGLKVIRNADHFEVSWSPLAAAVQAARYGTLSILVDGHYQTATELDTNQLRSGHILYGPVSDDELNFRLQLNGDVAQTESVQLLPRVKSPAIVVTKQLGQPSQATPTAQGRGENRALSPVAKDAAPPVTTQDSQRQEIAKVEPPRQREQQAPVEAPQPTPRTFVPPPATAGTRAAIIPLIDEAPLVTVQTAASSPVAAAPLSQLPKLAAPPEATPLRTEARLLRGPAPQYPQSAKSAHISGRVKLQIRIGADGRVTAPQVLSGNIILARAAAEAVAGWVYEPAKSNGQPVPVTIEVEFNFKLPQ
jgi:TonB family protein